MDVDLEDGMQVGAGDEAKAESAVANNAQGRHDPTAPVLPPGGVDLKLSVAMETLTDHDSPPDQLDKDKEKDKGRKRRKHQHRQRHVRNNKKGWLWRRELAEAAGAAAGAAAAAGGGRPGAGREGSPTRTAALPAPNNTTQFIMEDHTELQDLNLEAQRGARTTRSRDPSFSIDSEDESSSYEEELYLSKEFSNTYEDVHVERLGTMTKLDLIQEYLQLEQRVNVLEKKLMTGQNSCSAAGDCGVTGTDSDSEVAEGEVPVEPAMVEKIRIFQEEIQKLVVENEFLAQENQRLQSSSSLIRPSSSSLSSSIDSESDSSTTSGSSSTSSSSGKSKASKRSRSRGSQSSKSSRSSSLKSSENISSQTLPAENGTSNVEIAMDNQSNKLTPVFNEDQEMETETTGELQQEILN